MAKSDLKARPVFTRQRDSIETHLTIVFTALTISRHLQEITGISIKRILDTLRPVRSAIIRINDTPITIDPDIPPAAQTILNTITQATPTAGH